MAITLQPLLHRALYPTLLLCLADVPIGEARSGRDEGHWREAGEGHHRGRTGNGGCKLSLSAPNANLVPGGRWVSRAELSQSHVSVSQQEDPRPRVGWEEK